MIAFVALLTGISVWAFMHLTERGIWKIALRSRRTVQRSAGSYHIRFNYKDYSRFTMSFGDKLSSIAAAGAALYSIGYIFYQHPWVSAALAVLSLRYPEIRKRKLIEKQQKNLSRQFKLALYSLSSALGAGHSVENAFRETVKDLKQLYAEAKIDMISELEIINHKVENGISVEKAVEDLSRRAGIEDIENFSDVFQTCKRTGGDLIEVMRRTSNIIGEKMEVEQEISVMIAQKRFESKALSFLPVGIIAFVSFSSPDYMAPLYQGIGPAIMTGCLLLLAAAYWLNRRIMNIRV
ncbi:type II secretion system F family protein [Ferviditalea candida]|uniref:Type II secretion system F family protein n=1 Tax=Ferviditalea candida TaxID=3108399 RepID=A0ABU5ZLZ9_9BACL|nr:type II secretion system F family protein [Paenibacillaceae bacterium T2]